MVPPFVSSGIFRHSKWHHRSQVFGLLAFFWQPGLFSKARRQKEGCLLLCLGHQDIDNHRYKDGSSHHEGISSDHHDCFSCSWYGYYHCYAQDASTTVTVSTSLVITASPVTQTTTPTAAVFTTTSTIVAQAIATVVASYYTVCDPSRQYDLDYWTETDGGSMYIGTTPDALTCCQVVTAVPGAVAFAFCVDGSTAEDCQGGRVNACYGIEIGNTALCVAGNPATQYFYQAGNGEVGASLQCGTGSIG